MKTFSRVLFVTAAAFLVACGGGPTANLTQKWKFNDVKVNGKSMEEFMDSQMNEMLSSLGMEGEELEKAKAEAKARMEEEKAKQKENLDKNTMEFKEDGSFVSFTNGKERPGTWQLSEDGKTLTTKDNENSSEQKIEVVNLTSSSLVLKMEDAGQSMEVYLVPVK